MHIEQIRNSHEFFRNGYLKKEEVETALDFAVGQIDLNMDLFGESFPGSSTKNNSYPTIDNVEWTSGFWTGMLWLAYEYTNNEKYANLAKKNVDSFINRINKKIEVNHHDLGFLYSPSTVAWYKLSGDEDALQASIAAAEQLVTRYNEKGKFIQAWGDKGDASENRLIIDALLNIPLLYWASKVTNDDKYRKIAYEHYKTAKSTVFREDGSTHHTYYFDKNGVPVKGVTRQGYSDESSWARGQAWAIYGNALQYYNLQDEKIFDDFKSVTNFYLNRLPADNVPYWDLIFQDGSGQSRDSSAASIAVCGMNEMLKYIPESDEYKLVYQSAAHSMLKALIYNYANTDNNKGGAPLLLHGVYSWHSDHGVDEGNLWGDYFYMEALIRFYKNWKIYW
ncbi:glycoside hydrolase family 88 protein [Tetragenococcus halophilus]|uniref:glycoside hydrolase family 88 protein n=1 Tax=Tetragenococcus halophilus TaxID=51669 RepID=UPI0021BA7FF4|nr:glycoside hydrolase family 88 protein [Tetragenococcus halophilus]MCT8311230.1 glycoside hydrolase family 88 protein [Tetragenococcus halophilus]